MHDNLLNKMSIDGSTTGMYHLKMKVSHAVWNTLGLRHLTFYPSHILCFFCWSEGTGSRHHVPQLQTFFCSRFLECITPSVAGVGRSHYYVQSCMFQNVLLASFVSVTVEGRINSFLSSSIICSSELLCLPKLLLFTLFHVFCVLYKFCIFLFLT